MHHHRMGPWAEITNQILLHSTPDHDREHDWLPSQYKSVKNIAAGMSLLSAGTCVTVLFGGQFINNELGRARGWGLSVFVHRIGLRKERLQYTSLVKC